MKARNTMTHTRGSFNVEITNEKCIKRMYGKNMKERKKWIDLF